MRLLECPYEKSRHQVHMHRELALWRGNKKVAIGKEKPNVLTLWSWTSGFQNCEKINFCGLSHPIGGILFRQL